MQTQILVVEDDTMPRKALTRALENWRYKVISARDGAEAWELFQNNPVNLVISDWEMPELNGLELCRKVRTVKDRDYTYFVLLTSRTDKPSLVEALDAGADDFIAKPFDDGELHARIRSGERILRLSNELAHRLEQLMKANECIRKLNLQMARDMKSLVNAINGWVSTEAEREMSETREVRQELKGELTHVIEDWMSSLASAEAAP